jgi:RNA polymerase sigma-70 factor (ECF subfamily)
VQLLISFAGCIIKGMNLDQEKDLVDRAKNSSEAFGELYNVYYNQIFGYALRRSADIDIAKDITSAVFFKALKNIRKFQWRGVSFSHWLYRIANREIINHYNKRKRETSYEVAADTSNTALQEELIVAGNEINKHDDYLDLQSYISKLPSKYQEVITLKYFEDMSIGEIAQILQKPEGTVKSLLHRGVNQLRKMMESQR